MERFFNRGADASATSGLAFEFVSEQLSVP
jgi:hypothetical protein